MQQYLDLIKHVLDNGSWQENRTGIRTLSVPGGFMRFDLQEGFPAVTTKKLAFKSAIGELVGFLRAYRSATDFRAVGSKVWDQNANENAQWLANAFRDGQDSLGDIYGAQWRQWPAYKILDKIQSARIAAAEANGYRCVTEYVEDGVHKVVLYKAIDQLRQCLDTIVSDPGSRRILFHGWNPAKLDEIALASCHLLYQFLPDVSKKEISLCLYLRSNDIGLGTPFNMCEGAALLHLVGRLTGYKPKWFNYFIGDLHAYENSLGMLREQITREPLSQPELVLSDRIPDYAVTGKYEPEWLEKVEPSDFALKGYAHHPPLTAPMAV